MMMMMIGPEGLFTAIRGHVSAHFHGQVTISRKRCKTLASHLRTVSVTRLGYAISFHACPACPRPTSQAHSAALAPVESSRDCGSLHFIACCKEPPPAEKCFNGSIYDSALSYCKQRDKSFDGSIPFRAALSWHSMSLTVEGHVTEQ